MAFSTVAHAIQNFLRTTETFLYDQVTHHQGFRPIVLTNRSRNQDRFPFSPVYELPERYTRSWLFNRAWYHLYASSRVFEKTLEKERAFLIHAHFGPMGCAMLPLARRAGLPLVTSFYGFDASSHPLANPGCYAGLFRDGSLFIAFSQDMQSDLLALGCPEDRVRVVHGGVDCDSLRLSAPRTHNEDKVNLLLIGRFVEKKGISYALEALARIRPRHPGVSLTLIGNGPLCMDIEAKIGNLGLTDAVRLLADADRTTVLSELTRAHILLQPSVTAADGDKEGVPTTLKEAGAMELPVVATRHAGLTELVEDGKSGFLVPERDVNALEDRIDTLIADSALRRRMGKAGRRIVEGRFNLVRQMGKLENCYKEVL